MDGGAWWAAVHGVANSLTRLSNFTFTFHFHTLEKEMATHSSVLAWRIPCTEEPSRLPSMGSHRVRHDLAAAATMPSYEFLEIRCPAPPQGLLVEWSSPGDPAAGVKICPKSQNLFPFFLNWGIVALQCCVDSFLKS